MSHNTSKLAQLQGKLAVAPSPSFVPLADPLAVALMALPAVELQKYYTLLFETFAHALRDEADGGEAVCHAVARRDGTPSDQHGFGLARTLAEFGRVLAKVRAAVLRGGQRALERYAHTDAEFIALGLRFPAGHRRSSLWERMRNALRGGKEETSHDIDKARDLLFDARRNEYFHRRHDGTWMGPFPAKGFAGKLEKLGVHSKVLADFTQWIPYFDSKRDVFDDDRVMVIEQGEHIWNTFVGWPYEVLRVDRGLPHRSDKLVVVEGAGAWPHIFQVMLNLAGGNQDHLDYLLDWLAAPLQSLYLDGKPLKMRTAIIIHGDEGAGKGTLVEILTLFYGAQYVITQGQSDVDGKFHGQLEGKLFVIGNEIMSSTNRSGETQNRLKPWITDDRIPVEPKHVQGKNIDNHFNILFTSNDEKPLIVPKKDRRYSVLWSGPIISRALAARVHADIDGPQRELRGFLQSLLRRKTAVEPGQLLETTARKQLQATTAPSEVKFAAALARDGWLAVSRPWAEAARPAHRDDREFNRVVVEDTDLVLASRLHDVYRDWCAREGNLRPTSSARLGVALKEQFKEPFKEAKSGSKKLNGIVTQVWEGLPMHPPPGAAETELVAAIDPPPMTPSDNPPV